MSSGMVAESERDNTPDGCPGQAADDVLTPKTREVLGNLALNAQTHTELGDALAEADSMLASVVERHPKFDGPAAEWRAKLAQPEDLRKKTGKAVMRYSLAYGDVVVASQSQKPTQA